jgi:ArsR family transcriptional regulator, arsenate/arsenite/antimonite-responsive transcriptional repressor
MTYRLDPAAFFLMLSDDLRRRILVLLLHQESLCVCELFYGLGVAQPKVSRHLALMRTAGVLSQRRCGKWVIYRLHRQMPLWAVRILEQMAEGMHADGACRDDGRRLANMPNRPDRPAILGNARVFAEP